MQSRSYLFLAVVLALSALSGFLYTQRPFTLGLDVKGGTRVTLEMDTSQLAPGTSLAAVQEQVATTIEGRATGGLGVAEPIIQKKGDRELIVELPGMKDIDKALATLSTTARIEWYHATNLVTEKAAFRPYTDEKGEGDTPVVWFRKRGDDKDIKPGDPEYARIIKDWKLILSGNEIADAQPVQMTAAGGYIPSLKLNREGARKMEKWSRENTYRQEKIAAVLDGVVLNVSPLKEGAIISDQAVIEGQFETEYVKNLCSLIRSGSLPVSLKITSSSVLDPTVGQFALNQILAMGALAFVLIGIFLLLYYVFPGFVALLALFLYVLFTLTALKWAGATFSLAAIAGFVLSVGMAVDANILVFERFKEEMRGDRPLMRAIELGFNRALPAIIDSNACTILTSLVLVNLGTGPVKGFAVTLIIGVFISLFTAIVVTRSLLVFLVGSGIGANPKLYGLDRSWFGEKFEREANVKPFKVVEKSKLYFAISGLTIVPGLIFLAMGGLKKNVEFTGGYEGTYVAKNRTSADIMKSLETAGIRGANIKFQTANDERLASITVPEVASLGSNEAQLRANLAKAAGFAESDLRAFSTVSATIRDETIKNAVLGVILSSGLIVLWLAIRFGFALGGFVIGLRFAMSVILALIHDVLIVIGLAAIMGALAGWEISALFISAMLTVIGFSTHDTIVIFDRIRENLRKPLPGEDIAHLVNRSITQSFARSINTSGTVILTLALLIIWGSATPELKLFNAAMLVGILSGTYSSIFNAAPILYLWDRMVLRRKGEEHALIGMAKAATSRVRLTQTAVPAAAGTTPSAPTAPAGYGQTRRRARDTQRGVQSIDDDL